MFYAVDNNNLYYSDVNNLTSYGVIKELAGITKSEYLKNADKYKIKNGKLVDISNTEEYKQAKAQEKQTLFEKEFFLTSLGYIRRNVSMATGESKDFLSDLLPAISAGLQIGQQTPIITYKQPDFTQEFSIEYMESLQEIKPVTAEFVQECFQQIASDFMPTPLQVEVKE